ncbi:hypothetical protein FGO68_gene14947 [Halteria grandinella]|uniref:Uncharacterized protein n=1 Tax=Halteria grandinella TaxID=5974 RepID=A0A8J8T4U4_HALGN|nr:hypothetical protein FGO68_gene14947 [Halteria grandinella]
MQFESRTSWPIVNSKESFVEGSFIVFGLKMASPQLSYFASLQLPKLSIFSKSEDWHDKISLLLLQLSYETNQSGSCFRVAEKAEKQGTQSPEAFEEVVMGDSSYFAFQCFASSLELVPVSVSSAMLSYCILSPLFTDIMLCFFCDLKLFTLWSFSTPNSPLFLLLSQWFLVVLSSVTSHTKLCIEFVIRGKVRGCNLNSLGRASEGCLSKIFGGVNG